MKTLPNNKIKDYFFLLLIAIIAYWPVSFMLFSVKNDAINYFLAMRYNTSEAIQAGYFPSWSVYINMGYPLHADMQSGVWNPVVFLMSLVRKYDIYWLHVETILVVFIAGISMYHLLKYFKLNNKVVLAISAAYMMNGYISDAGQFLNWLYAAAFLPFVFLCAIRSFHSFTIKDAFLLGLSYSFMLLCSYPADFILLSYLLFGFVISLFFSQTRLNGVFDTVKKFGRQIFIAAGSFLLICLPAILSYIPFINSINRGGGVDIKTALSNSMAPANFISFIVPWATQEGSAFALTDPLTRNSYMGIILLAFFVLFFIRRKQKTFIQKFFIATFFIFIIFSLGEAGGLRVLLYKFVPLMDTFRHPANAKLFFIFAGQLLAAFAINNYLDTGASNKKYLQGIIISLITLTFIGLLIGLVNSNILQILNNNISETPHSLTDKLKLIKDNLSFFDMLFLNSLFTFLALIVFYLVTKKNLFEKYFLPVIVIEMFIIVQGMIPLTYVKKLSPVAVQNILNQQPKGYPLPDPITSIKNYSKDGMKYFETIGCLNPYNKKPGRSDYIITPANLSSQDFFWDYTLFREKIIKYPLAYFADTIYSVKDTANFISSVSNKKAAFIASLDKKMMFDATQQENMLIFKKFVPGIISIETNSTKPEFLVLLQNNYPNWNVSVNGKKANIIKTNLSFMGVWLSPGKNNVTFTYEYGLFKYLGIFSILFVLMGLIIISIRKTKKE